MTRGINSNSLFMLMPTKWGIARIRDRLRKQGAWVITAYHISITTDYARHFSNKGIAVVGGCLPGKAVRRVRPVLQNLSYRILLRVGIRFRSTLNFIPRGLRVSGCFIGVNRYFALCGATLDDVANSVFNKTSLGWCRRFWPTPYGVPEIG